MIGEDRVYAKRFRTLNMQWKLEKEHHLPFADRGFVDRKLHSWKQLASKTKPVVSSLHREQKQKRN